MKRFIKKLMSLSLVLLLCIGLLPAAAAEEADYTFTLASPDSVTVDYRKEYTTFGVELSSMPPVDESAGQSFVLVFTEGSMTDGTNTVPYDVLTVMEYGMPCAGFFFALIWRGLVHPPPANSGSSELMISL